MSKSAKNFAIVALVIFSFLSCLWRSRFNSGMDVHDRLPILFLQFFFFFRFFVLAKTDSTTSTSLKVNNDEEFPNTFMGRRSNSVFNKSRSLLSASKSISIYPMLISERTLCNGWQMKTPTIISVGFTGLTNVLFSMSLMVYLSNKLQVPFETVGFLNIGCDNAWPQCNDNSIIPVSDLFDFKVAGLHLNVSMKEVSNNYCYNSAIPANSEEFNFSTFKIEGWCITYL